MEHDGYQELANAIVIRAAKDYRNVHTSFFQSLTTLDVDRIFSEIRAKFE